MFNEQINKLEEEMEAAERAAPRLCAKDCWSLFRFLEHGSKGHRYWLAEAILAWSLGKPKPEERE